MAATKQHTVDWEKVERQYRLGELTLEEIGKKHTLALSTITRRAKKFGWTRALSKVVHAVTQAKDIAKRRAEHEAKLLAEDSQRSSEDEQRSSQRSSAQALISAERAISDVDFISDENSDVLSEHRAQCKALRRGMFKIAEGVIADGDVSLESLEMIAERIRAGDDEEAMKALQNHLRANQRAVTLKTLGDGIAKVIEKERQATGIDDKTDGGNTGEGMAQAVKAMT